MILKEIYFKEITLDNDSKEEFKEKLGEALDMLNHATEDCYDKMTTDGFMDWACDLSWIAEKNIIIKVNGKVSKIVEELMNEIVEFWANAVESVIKGGKNRNFEFIIMDN